MKKERLEELVNEVCRNSVCAGEPEYIRAALLAVERETVERIAKACDGQVVGGDYIRSLPVEG